MTLWFDYCLFLFCKNNIQMREKNVTQIKKHKKKYNEKTNQTLVVIVGGWDDTTKEKSNEIYYCVSNDINNKNNNDQSIWQLSLIKLPFALCDCQCMITDKKNKNPKLIILGGRNETGNPTKAYFEYNLSDIIGYDTFNRFMIDLKQV